MAEIDKSYQYQSVKEEFVVIGASGTPPQDPVRIGYKFVGWHGDYNNVTSDISVYALYEPENGVVSDGNEPVRSVSDINRNTTLYRYT